MAEQSPNSKPWNEPESKEAEDDKGERKAEGKKAEDDKFKNDRAEDVKAEDVKAEDVKAEDVKAEDVKAEDVKAEDVKAEDVKAEDVKAEDVKAEDNKAEGDKAEDDKAEDEKVEPNLEMQLENVLQKLQSYSGPHNEEIDLIINTLFPIILSELKEYKEIDDELQRLDATMKSNLSNAAVIDQDIGNMYLDLHEIYSKLERIDAVKMEFSIRKMLNQKVRESEELQKRNRHYVLKLMKLNLRTPTNRRSRVVIRLLRSWRMLRSALF
ncbi:translation initiation factor IF-2 isoform X2 [Drosophila tropicalis]|uniref:translation initiation factor IF-2 isoform X2 n=1 Tax=Drosophila tropicalis TaxID=46794 RepID=UPI0035ABB71D